MICQIYGHNPHFWDNKRPIFSTSQRPSEHDEDGSAEDIHNKILLKDTTASLIRHLQDPFSNLVFCPGYIILIVVYDDMWQNVRE